MSAEDQLRIDEITNQIQERHTAPFTPWEPKETHPVRRKHEYQDKIAKLREAVTTAIMDINYRTVHLEHLEKEIDRISGLAHKEGLIRSKKHE